MVAKWYSHQTICTGISDPWIVCSQCLLSIYLVFVKPGSEAFMLYILSLFKADIWIYLGDKKSKGRAQGVIIVMMVFRILKNLSGCGHKETSQESKQPVIYILPTIDNKIWKYWL